MKKITLLFSLLFVLIISAPFCAGATEVPKLVDNAVLLNREEQVAVAEELNEITEKHVNANYTFVPVIVTVNSLDGKTPEAYADDYFDYNGYGDDGCLLLISMEDRDWHISTKGYGITAITDYGISVMEDEIVPYLSEGDYYKAFHTYAKLVDDFLDAADKGTPYDTNKTYKNYSIDSSQALISVIVAAVIAFVVISMVKKSYKPVTFNSSASNYLVDGSLNVKKSHDAFVYSTVSKVKKESNSGSGGGSSTHSSSSGSSHGGGGGKF